LRSFCQTGLRANSRELFGWFRLEFLAALELILGQVRPARIQRFDQSDFPQPEPALDLFFAPDRFADLPELPKINPLVRIILPTAQHAL
jgi:hypothetical protein